jgi:CheY-like chemotaxis protein
MIFIDRDLPDAPAVELLRRFAEDSVARRIPTIVLSGDDDPRDRLALRQAGADDVLGAPLDATAIVSAASDALAQRVR